MANPIAILAALLGLLAGSLFEAVKKWLGINPEADAAKAEASAETAAVTIQAENTRASTEVVAARIADPVDQLHSDWSRD